MTGGTIARCGDCGRLIIYGQICVCSPDRASRCDCTHDGNVETIGPRCRERQRQAWRGAVEGDE